MAEVAHLFDRRHCRILAEC